MNEKYMFYTFLFILIVPNIALSITEDMSMLARVTNVLFPFSVYYFIFSRLRNCGSAFWYCFTFIFLGAFQLVLLYLFGRSIIAVDMFLNLMTTNANEAMELLDNLLPAIVIVVLLYVPALTVATVYVIKKKSVAKYFRRQYGKYILSAGVVSLLLTFLFDPKYSFRDDLYPVNVCQNICYAFERNSKTKQYAQTSANFKFHAQSLHHKEQKEIYVMVIGETSRADNWSLFGYERNTNPQLSRTEGIITYPYVLSESNTTHKSVPMLMSPVSAADFDSIYYKKGILTVFNEAGYQTAFYSNQMRNNSFIDFFGEQAQTSKFIKDDKRGNDIVSDEELLKYVNNEINRFLASQKNKLFLVLHTYGSHFNYKERYLPQYVKFIPDTPMDAEYKFRQNILNAYDNSIVQTDAFLAKLIKRVQKESVTSAVYYTSDHGEDIFDDDRHLFLHASPIPSFYQLHVPMFVWFSKEYQYNYPYVISAAKSNSNKFVDSNLSFFYTMLDIAGITIANDRKDKSVVHRMYRPSAPVYLSDHNEGLTMKCAGWGEKDFEYARKKGIKVEEQ